MTDEPQSADEPTAGNPAGDRDGAEGASGSVRLTAAADDGQQPRLPFPVVGVGASAGGLEAYTELLNALPPDSGMAFVLIQHLPPDRESLLVDLLGKQTPMPVMHVEDGQAVEPNTVYVIRPGHTLTIQDGKLHLGPELAARGHGRPVDDFFRSLAEEQQQRAIAVVLSGMGSNGTAGAEAVKAVGGLVVAQDPESAKYPHMPRSLIESHLADFVLRPAEIPDVLRRYATHPYVVADRPVEQVARREEHALGEILAVIRTRARHDFSGYRKPTLLRRVLRRMGLGQVATMAEYAKELRQSSGEVSSLADDLLIHVTGFFRDPEVWQALREKVIDPLVAERPDGSPIRCWVTACATGEEAYTLAILLTEAAEKAGKRFDIKVFATDMAERALAHARSGVFPNGIESEVAPERLERFYDKDDTTYRVKRALRELVVFAPQNVLQDPPFSRMDIITCRNLLIYLEPELQKRVLSLLHFGLREGGTLVLGTSESAGHGEGGFTPIDKKYRLYRRIGPTRHGTLDYPHPPGLTRRAIPPPAQPGTPVPQGTIAQLTGRALLEGYTPAAAVVDGLGQIVYFHGDTGRYIDQPRGEPTHDLLVLANDQVRGAVRTALHRASDTQLPVTVRDGLIDTPDGRRRVEVGVALLLDRRAGGPHYLVTFRDYPEPPALPLPAGDPSGERRLVDDLARTRDELQTALEETQTSNEELRASYEELQTSNEELQSLNEELETSKEELHSLNEELTTVNAQYQAKLVELEAATNDLTSLLASTDIAVIFLDHQLRIRRYTPPALNLFELIPSDAGRPIHDLRRKFTDPHLLPDAQAVLDRLVPVEREVAGEGGRAYLRRTRPYRTSDNRIGGVVVTFVDVTRQRADEAALRASEGRLRLALAAARMGIWTLDADTGTQMRDANLNALLGLAAVETTQPFTEFLTHIHPADRPAVQAAFARSSRDHQPLNVEFRVARPDGAARWLRDQGDVFHTAGSRLLAGACVDISDLKGAEAALQTAHDELEERVRERTGELAAVVDELEAEVARRRDLARQLATAQEDERRRVARELHDSVGQLLTALTLAVKAARDAAPPPTAAQLDEVQRVADDLGKTTHDLAVRLRPTALDDLGLAAALAQYLNEWFARTGVAVEYDASAVEAERLPAEVETAFYRIVQEALTNVARHARATRVGVVIGRRDGTASLTVEDDGVGFDPDAATKDRRLGIVGMRERVALLGGELDIESSAAGTTVFARVPLTDGFRSGPAGPDHGPPQRAAPTNQPVP